MGNIELIVEDAIHTAKLLFRGAARNHGISSKHHHQQEEFWQLCPVHFFLTDKGTEHAWDQYHQPDPRHVHFLSNYLRIDYKHCPTIFCPGLFVLARVNGHFLAVAYSLDP